MLIDITLRITPEMVNTAKSNEKKSFAGHIGTHFDIMNKEFPLEYTERRGIIFDVSNVSERDITCCDLEMSVIEPNMFVAFYTGFIEAEVYGSRKYFTEHPQLSNELIGELISDRVSIIGVDFAGVRRGSEHTPTDQYCADNNIFIIENLCNLNSVLQTKQHVIFTANTYPMNYAGVTGLPCRVIARI